MNYPNFDGANCKGIGTELYYPDVAALSSENRMAKDLCKNCPVLIQCLDWALVHEDQGIWGGTTPHQRRLIRKKRNIIFIALTSTMFVKGLT